MTSQTASHSTPKSLPFTIGVVSVGTACTALLLSAGVQPDASLMDAGVSLMEFVGAYISAGVVAERVADHIEDRRPGASNRLLASRPGQVLSKLAAGRVASTLVSSAAAISGAIASRSLVNDLSDPVSWGVGLVSAATLAATVGLIGTARDAIDDASPSNDAGGSTVNPRRTGFRR